MIIQRFPCATTNFMQGRPAGMKPEAIVVHISTGTLASADSWFNDPSARVSSHYIVAKSGVVHQYVEEADTAFHAGVVVQPTWPLLKPNVNPNFYTIGIEHEGQEHDVWPEIQIQTSAALIGSIAGRWGIPLDDQHVIPHHAIRATKTCPGSFITIPTLLGHASTVTTETPSPIQSVDAIATLNIRDGNASRNSPIVAVVPPGKTLSPVVFVEGEAVNGNQYWYRDANGHFFWAGGTTAPNPALLILPRGATAGG